MSGEYLVLIVGNLALMAGGAGALGLGERYIPGYLQRRGRSGELAVMAAAVGVAAVYLVLAAVVLRFGLLGFKEYLTPHLAMGQGRGARQLVLASLFVSVVVAVYVPVFYRQRILRFRRGRQASGAPPP